MIHNIQLLQVLVITLKDSSTRQQKVISEMAKISLEWSFVDAVNGSHLDLATIKAYKPQKVKRLLGFELTSKEIGCYLSHMKSWHLCVDKNIPTLIFEDDFVLMPHFEAVVDTLINNFKQWDIVRLQALLNSQCFEVSIFDTFKIIKNKSDPLGATAYLVNPMSAKQLIMHSAEIFEPVDHFLEHHEKHGLKMLAVKPYPVTVVDATTATSTINDRPERHPIKGLKKIIRSLARLIDRKISNSVWFPKKFNR
jgi:glycosyl transferase, family 25